VASFSVLTVSDSCSRGHREDGSGPAIINLLEEAGYRLADYRICADGVEEVSKAVRDLCLPETSLLLTTGGTGFSPRDMTPEATEQECSRRVPGIPEMLRQLSAEKVKTAWLSRGTAGIRGTTLVINLPGSVKAVTQCVGFLLPVLDHALEVLAGSVTRCGG